MVHLLGLRKRGGTSATKPALSGQEGTLLLAQGGIRSEVFAINLAERFLIVLDGVVVLSVVRSSVIAH